MRLFTRWMRLQIRLLKPFVTGMDIEACRKSQDRLGAMGARILSEHVHVEDAGVPGVTTAWLSPTPEKTRGSRAILYLHGGGYTAGNLEYAKGFGSILCNMTQQEVLCAAYRLAPETPFPGALEDALAAYRAMLCLYAPENISLVGESAGGGLCFALALRLKELALPQPCCIVALSPWTDLTMTSESVKNNQKRDPCLSAALLDGYAEMYAQEDRRNPLVSPLFGALEGLPPSAIFVGTHEVLLDDSTVMAERLREAGVKCELHVARGMWHVYPLYGVREARMALRRILAFIDEHTKDGPAHDAQQSEE